jgi:hypothetical protein
MPVFYGQSFFHHCVWIVSIALAKKAASPSPFLSRWYHSHNLTLYFPQRYLIAGFFLCFSPKQKPLCKKDAEEAKPAEEVKKEEEKPNDVEAGGAAGDEGGVKAQVY